MTQIPDLPAVPEADISDDDLMLLYDVGAASNKSRNATRAHFLKDVVRTTGTYAVGTLNATGALNAPEGALDELTVAVGLDMGATLSKVLIGSASVTIPTAAAGVQVMATITVTGAQTGDVVTVHAPADLPAGLILRATVTAADTVTVYAFNATSGSIASDDYALKALVLRVA